MTQQALSGAALSQSLRADASKVLMLAPFTPHQIAIQDVSCDGRTCQLALQLPPFVEASIRHDGTVAADLMAALNDEFAKQGAHVGLTELKYTNEGMAISFQVDAAPERGRYLTDTELPKIRSETIQEYLKSQEKK